MTDVISIDPRTGQDVEVVAPETSTADVDRLCSAAGLDLDRLERADLLVALADALEARRDDVVAVADRVLRPITWQNAPYAVLPPELRDGPVDIPRRVDGRLVLP